MTYSIDFTTSDLSVDSTLSHKDQIFAYNSAFKKLDKASQIIEQDKNNAIQQNNSDLNLEIDKEIKRLKFIALPFYLAQEKAKKLKSEGFILIDLDGHITKNDTPSDQVPDPLVSLFMILLNAIIDGLLDNLNTNHVDDYKQSLDFVTITTPIFVFQLLASDTLQDNNGEIAQLIKDPIVRPIVIVQNIVNVLLNKPLENDNGDVGNAGKAVVKKVEEIIGGIGKSLGIGW
ncbi:hypothetical protein [Acinetobacter baumannii]|uniref:hypothetical protein n=1 Tax=Acinetobacter baumannii TaxID=470 RepID=UPI0029B5B7F7|nr:hypothetical protein [Acinetobacter baumannii]